MNIPAHLAARVVLPAAKPDRPRSPQGEAFAQALTEVAGAAGDMTRQQTDLARQLRNVVKTRDTAQLPAIYAQVQNIDVQQQIMATTVSKVTSGVDRLLQMQ